MIRESTGSLKLYVLQVDLSDMASVRSLAENIIKLESKLDILVCNGSIVLDRLQFTSSKYNLLTSDNLKHCVFIFFLSYPSDIIFFNLIIEK